MTRPRIYSVGHSSRTREVFVHILCSCGIKRLIDVRRFPVSRRHPHFSRPALETVLGGRGIEYIHLGSELGGYRKERYEDYVRTEGFLHGLRELERQASREASAIMCAEKLPWQCHRRFIAKELVKKGWRVLHILDEDTLWDPEQPFLTLSPGAGDTGEA